MRYGSNHRRCEWDQNALATIYTSIKLDLFSFDAAHTSVKRFPIVPHVSLITFLCSKLSARLWTMNRIRSFRLRCSPSEISLNINQREGIACGRNIKCSAKCHGVCLTLTWLKVLITTKGEYDVVMIESTIWMSKREWWISLHVSTLAAV